MTDKNWFGMSIDALNCVPSDYLHNYLMGRAIDAKRYALTIPHVEDLIAQYKDMNYFHSVYYFVGVHHALTRGANS